MLALSISFGSVAPAAEKAPTERTARLKTYGQYSPKAAKKAQRNVDAAMTTPMPTLMREAAELNAEAMLNYGLALELGRPPATRDMDPRERAQVQAVFQTLLVLYIRAKDDIKLQGTEAILLDQPDFWILMARSMSFVPPPIYGEVTDGATGTVTAVTQQPLMMTAIDGKRYSLKGHPMLDTQIVSAAQACAIYARVSARMYKVMTVAPASAPHLDATKLGELKTRAKTIYTQSRAFGVDACAGDGAFKKVRAFAGQNLGKLGALTDDPTALVTPEETSQ